MVRDTLSNLISRAPQSSEVLPDSVHRFEFEKGR